MTGDERGQTRRRGGGGVISSITCRAVARLLARWLPTFNLEARLDSTRSDRSTDLVLFRESQVYYVELTEYGALPPGFECYRMDTFGWVNIEIVPLSDLGNPQSSVLMSSVNSLAKHHRLAKYFAWERADNKTVAQAICTCTCKRITVLQNRYGYKAYRMPSAYDPSEIFIQSARSSSDN